MNIVQNPHDKFFKEIFGNPEVMKDFLQNYLSIMYPIRWTIQEKGIS